METLLFIFFCLILGLAFAKEKSGEEQKMLQALPQLADDLKLKVLDSSKDAEILSQKLEGSFKGFDIHIRFKKKSEKNTDDSLISVIKLDLNIFSPYYYELIPKNLKFGNEFSAIVTNDPLLKKDPLYKGIQRFLVKNYAFLRHSIINIHRGVLDCEGPNFLEDEEELKFFKQLLQVLSKLAKDIKNYSWASSVRRYPNFISLVRRLNLEAIIHKNALEFQNFQQGNHNMPILLHHNQLDNNSTGYLSLHFVKDTIVAKFEIRLGKNTGFNLAIFPDKTTGLMSWLKGQDIEIRDDEFDEAFIIQSNDQLKAKLILMNQSFREDLLELSPRKLKWSIENNSIQFEIGWDENDNLLVSKMEKLFLHSNQITDSL